MAPLLRLCSAMMLLLSSSCVFAQIPDTSTQLVVVTTPDWGSTQGTAQRYERRGETFEKFGAPFSIVVGKSGMAWGSGITPVIHGEQPAKREGDGKAPAGIFKLGTAFGYAPVADTRLPYAPSTASLECVDDSQSSHYNTLVDKAVVDKDWTSAEPMRRKDQLYSRGIFVEHNTPASANAGSCIFLHVWRSAGSPTLGCTAMAPESIQVLFAWLVPDNNPVLVQLPREQYEQFRERWKLPKH